jgi:NAD(P)-dependent dehydrogenase (short-subunit alcohol dehydrogenase family)
MHSQGDPKLEDLISNNGRTNYSDSKLHMVLLAMAVARKWPEVYANAVNPGWVPTKMGGRGAPDDLDKGVETQSWLAVSNDDKAKVSGHYFFHQQQARYLPRAADTAVQDKFLLFCEKISGVYFPGA